MFPAPAAGGGEQVEGAIGDDGGDGGEQVDWVQVVVLDEDMLTGTRLGVITDPDMDGVASGAIFGDSLYVNNARYYDFPVPENEYWITKLSIYDVEQNGMSAEKPRFGGIFFLARHGFGVRLARSRQPAANPAFAPET